MSQKKFFKETKAKLKPVASSSGAKQYGDRPTNRRTESLIEVLTRA